MAAALYEPPYPDSHAVSKPQVAQLSCPTRHTSGWCLAKQHILSRYTRRWVVLRSCMLAIYEDQPPQATLLSSPAPILSVCVCGASISTSTPRKEVTIKVAGQRIVLQWDTDKQYRSCIAAFNYANRDVHKFYKLVDTRELGRGRASKVVFAFDVSAGTHSAVKIVSKKAARPSERLFAEREVAIRCSLQHPALVQTLDIFESPDDLYLVTEFMSGGSLQKRLCSRAAPLPEADARIIMARTFCALRHLHARDIVHRNVKTENIMLDNTEDSSKWATTAKLSDLSLACRLADSDAALAVVGTPDYLAPEAAAMVANAADGTRSVRFGTEVDMWAAGVMLYNILSLTLPFDAESPSEVLKKVRNTSFDFTPHAFARTSHECRSLIRALLNPSRRKRLTAAAALQHPWFTGGIPLEPTAAPRPVSRKSARAAAQAAANALKAHPSVKQLPGTGSKELLPLHPARKAAIEKLRAAITAVRILNRWKWAVRVPYDPPAVATPEPSQNALLRYNSNYNNNNQSALAASSKASISSSITSKGSAKSISGGVPVFDIGLTHRRPRVNNNKNSNSGTPPPHNTNNSNSMHSPRVSNSSTVRTWSSTSDEQVALKLCLPPSPGGWKNSTTTAGRSSGGSSTSGSSIVRLEAFSPTGNYRVEDRSSRGFLLRPAAKNGTLHATHSFRSADHPRRHNMVSTTSSPNLSNNSNNNFGIRVLQSPEASGNTKKKTYNTNNNNYKNEATLQRQWSLRDNTSPASSAWGL